MLNGSKGPWDCSRPRLPSLFRCRALRHKIGGRLFPESVAILGLIHLKDNVFISATGVPQISDFGMSRMIGASQRIRQTTTGSIRGSIPWMAMELFESGESKVTYTRETDIWAFGMTVYVSFYHDTEDDLLKNLETGRSLSRGSVPTRTLTMSWH